MARYLVALLLIQIVAALNGSWRNLVYSVVIMIESTESFKPSIPHMFNLDFYDECFKFREKYAKNVYCMGDVYIKPNESSQIWNEIVKSSYVQQTQFRHDHLVKGICISKCKALMSKFDVITQNQFIPSKLSDYQIDPFTYKHAVEDTFMYNAILNECTNYQMQKQFQLKAFFEVQYCEVSGRVEEIGKL